MAKILVISPTPSHPQDAGNRARIFSLLSGLRSAGHQVYFTFVRVESGDEAAMASIWDGFFPIPYQRPRDRWLKRQYDKWAKRLGVHRVIPYRIDDWYYPGMTDVLREIRKKVEPDVVLVEYVFMSKAMECFGPDTLKILDTHDVFGNRARLFFKNNKRPMWFYTSEDEEKKGVERADLILAIQSREAEYFKNLTKNRILTVGHLITPGETGAIQTPFPPRLLFVGSSNHSNIDGINWFLEHVFSILQEQYPRIELIVVGTVCNLIKKSPGVHLAGTVGDLAPYYKNASVVINPLQFGTGLKIKSLEALAMKRPLVTTPNGATGIEEWSDRAFLGAETPSEFSTAILQIINSEEIRDKLQKGAGEFIFSYNQQAFAPLLKEIDVFLKK